jgi:hypothetical protein
MCIIVIADKVKPSKKFLERCEKENRHGGGIAWREDGKIHFKKNLKASEIYAITQRVELPFVIHFRIASVGAVTPELCQPFPMGGDLRLKGNTNKGVLFHNGTWRDWEAMLYKTFPHPLPGGTWNDSRAMAYITKLWGENPNWLMLPGKDNRICFFTPDNLFTFGTWVREDDLLLSHTMKRYVPAPPTQHGVWSSSPSNSAKTAVCDGQPEPDNADEIQRWINDARYNR